MNVYSLNKKLVCQPFASLSVSIKESKGFATVEQRSELAQTTVLVGSLSANGDDLIFDAGDVVYLKADCLQHAWAKEVLTPDDNMKASGLESSFILVPQEMVVAVATLNDVDEE